MVIKRIHTFVAQSAVFTFLSYLNLAQAAKIGFINDVFALGDGEGGTLEEVVAVGVDFVADVGVGGIRGRHY